MSKGSRRERELVSLLQDCGMATYRPATVRFGENDIFGFFDVLALSPAHSDVYAIQVKSNGARGIGKWSNQTWLFRELGFTTLYAVPYDNHGWRIIHITDSGDWYNLVDERDRSCIIGEKVIEYFSWKPQIQQ